MPQSTRRSFVNTLSEVRKKEGLRFGISVPFIHHMYGKVPTYVLVPIWVEVSKSVGQPSRMPFASLFAVLLLRGSYRWFWSQVAPPQISTMQWRQACQGTFEELLIFSPSIKCSQPAHFAKVEAYGHLLVYKSSYPIPRLSPLLLHGRVFMFGQQVRILNHTK